MIPKQNFKLDVYTDVFLTVQGTLPLMCYDDSYDDTVEPVKTALEELRGAREEARYREIVDEANNQLNDSKKELSDAEATQKKELADAMQKINDAQKDIDDGEKELEDNEAKLNREIKKAKSLLNQGYGKLKAGEKEYAAQAAAFEAAKKQGPSRFPRRRKADIRRHGRNCRAGSGLKQSKSHAKRPFADRRAEKRRFWPRLPRESRP